ncbi:MAG: nickel pincer cofactor biosynthesis protein LarB [Oscillospiraceae bacterium]|jgi:NCAIR mutase (PurE)-related protein|nr:nickel pincer cofactor biosynthesis protein LarB [Oscillospiraceae bacterium]
MEASEILRRVAAGALSVGDAEAELNAVYAPPFDDLGYATVDHARKARTGASEVIYCAGKTTGQIIGVMQNMLSRGTQNVLATRAAAEVFAEVASAIPDARYSEAARIISVERRPEPRSSAPVLILCAGTSDIPVAEEAFVTADFHGCDVRRLYDVGVAGIHRLLARLDILEEAAVIVVIAGMEGALASVVGGLTSRPVIAVPTSIGYGANFGGLAALLAMLNSCASGVGVVNIDNGFGAAMLAVKIVKNIGK